ncbi:hypothetical protein QYE76_022892 [Lolium multiflorum]|uniref:Uncharacterized protein n=1 Tax=Lolium multiflorum TaxID=4521 RepID=A0AAD8VU81_LOLMU|nr:hypothetical protein QYE76_022892 [Lolium multiflorum]
MVKKKNSAAATSGATAKAPPNLAKKGAPSAPPPAPAPSAPSSSIVGPNPGDWPASTTTKRVEKKARSLGLISPDEGNVILPAAEEAEALPSKRSSGGFADEDDPYDIDEGFIEPPPKKSKTSAAPPDLAASEASAPATVPAAQISTASSLSKGKNIPSTAAAATPPSGKPDLRAVISSLESFASQYTSLEVDKAQLQKEVESSSSKLEGAIKIAAEARQEIDSLKEELEELKRRLKDEEAARLTAEARAMEKDDLLRQSSLALLSNPLFISSLIIAFANIDSFVNVFDTSPTNPTQEIFSELDETKAHDLIFHGGFQNTKEETEWGHEAATPQGGAARRARRPMGWAPRVPPALPLRLLNPSIAKTLVPRATIRKSSRDAAAVNPISGIQEIASGRRGESSPEGSTSPCPPPD